MTGLESEILIGLSTDDQSNTVDYFKHANVMYLDIKNGDL
jgi:hypothetical protein